MPLPCVTSNDTGNLWEASRLVFALRSATPVSNSHRSAAAASRPLGARLPHPLTGLAGLSVSQGSFPTARCDPCWKSQNWRNCVSHVVFFFLSSPSTGSVTNVFLKIKRSLSSTSHLNRIQNDLEHRPVSLYLQSLWSLLLLEKLRCALLFYWQFHNKSNLLTVWILHVQTSQTESFAPELLLCTNVQWMA